jgi:hypoxia up-regulated 1
MLAPRLMMLLLLLLLISFISLETKAQSIIAVDPGTNFMKVVLVQPGKVFDIALSTDSKRKIFTGLGIVDGVRAFGSESFNVYGKKPQNTIWRVRELLGRKSR